MRTYPKHYDELIDMSQLVKLYSEGLHATTADELLEEINEYNLVYFSYIFI